MTDHPAGARPSRAPGRRAAFAPLAALLGAAVALAGGLLRWLDQSYGTDRSGLLTRTGFQAMPGLLPLALVALAGLAASYAARGALRRVIGAAIVGVGAGLGAVALGSLTRPPRALTTDAGLPAPADLMGPVVVHPVGPLLGLAGAVLLAVAGVLVMTSRRAGRSLGARYERGTGPRATRVPDPVSNQAAPDDPDTMAALWKALDGGVDPTITRPADAPEDAAVPDSAVGPTPARRPD